MLYLSTKRCKTCRIEKPLEQFHRSLRGVGGRVKSCKPCLSDYARERRYGITGEEYRQMYEALQGICPLCLRFYEKLAVDHDHKTGVVRGLLCIGCNRSLGYVEDRGWRRRAIDYLRTHS